jgi:SAM-dependent methyltransferase
MSTTDAANAQASLEGMLKDEILRMYQDVADNPRAVFHFFHGREAAELFGYPAEWLDRAPQGAVASFAGVGNPHERSNLQPGETVLDLGSGAGLDAIISSWRVGATGKVVGVDLNPAMCLKAQAHAAATGVKMECREGRMEDIPVPDASVDVVISNGVINLSFRKRRVLEELFRVLRPGGRLSITDIVSAKQLSRRERCFACWKRRGSPGSGRPSSPAFDSARSRRRIRPKPTASRRS